MTDISILIFIIIIWMFYAIKATNQCTYSSTWFCTLRLDVVAVTARAASSFTRLVLANIIIKTWMHIISHCYWLTWIVINSYALVW